MRENIEDVFPMSDIQKGMIALSDLIKDRVVYHDQFVYPIPAVDPVVFKRAMELMVEKHQILRTRFDLYNYSQEVQIVEKNVEVDISFEDLSNLTEAEQRQRIESFMVEERNQRFEVEQGPLWRVSLHRVKKDMDIFILQFHHAILDGWSVATFNTELQNTYVQLQSDKDYKLAPLRSTYRDFVLKELSFKSDEKLAAYWKEELSEYKYFDLFTNTAKQAQHTVYLGEETSTLLMEKCKTEQIAPQTIFLGAFIYALKVLTFEEEVLIGLVSNTRPNVEDGDKMLGCFLNSLPFRVRPELLNATSWEQYFKHIENKFKEVKSNGSRTLADIANLIEAKGPIFNILFNYNNFHVYQNIDYDNSGEADSSSSLFKIESYEMTDTQMDLVINKIENNFSFLYRISNQLRTDTSLENLHAYVNRIIEQYLKTDESARKINRNDILGGEEFNRLTAGFNDTQKDYKVGASVLDLIDEKYPQIKNRVAIIEEEQFINYDELFARSEKVAAYLEEKYQVGAGDFVGLKLKKGTWMSICVLGVLKTGAAYLPIAIEWPQERLDFIQEDAQYKVCITEEELAKIKEFQSEGERVGKNSKPKGKDRAYALYTSGSTGKPKAAILPHEGILNRLLWMIEAFNVNEDDVLLLKSPSTFDVSVWEILLPMITGCKLIVCKEQGHTDPLYIQDLIDKHGVTILQFVPSMLEAFLASVDPPKCQSLRLVMSGGEILKKQTTKDFQNLLPHTQIINSYGLTEGCIDVTLYDVSKVDVEEEGVLVGYPAANTQIYIVNKNLELQPVGVPGEILLGGVQVAQGYLNRPELSARKFVQVPFAGENKVYRTGDLARWLPNGKLEYISRIDNQVQLRGYRIELGEVEHNVNRYADDLQSHVLAVNMNEEDKELVVYYTATEDINIPSIKKFLLDKLPPYMIPEFYVRIPEFPVTKNGKIDSRKLISDFNVDNSSGKEYVEARNDLDELLIGNLQKLVQVSEIGIDEEFIRLGLNSLKTIKFIAQINKKLKANFTIRDAHEYNTVRLFSDRIFLSNVLHTQSRDKILLQVSSHTPNAQKAFAVPGGLGQGFVTFKGLADKLDHYNLFAFDFHGRGNSRRPLDKVEDIAKDYILEMKKVQQEGPYTLFAYCLGAKIAYEMIVQLQQAGETVEKLYLFDGLAPDRYLDDVSGKTELLYSFYCDVFNFLKMDMSISLEEFKNFDEQEQMENIYKALEDVLPDDASKEEVSNYVNIRMNSFYFSKKYKPNFDNKIDANVIYYRLVDSNNHDLTTYNNIVKKKIDILMLPCGEHETFMTESENIAFIAKHISEDLINGSEILETKAIV